MGNKRMLHKNICTSDKIGKLTWFQEVLYYRILVCADDLGCFFSSAQTINDICFPGKQSSLKAIKIGTKRLTSVGLLELKSFNKREYLELKDWNKYQILRSDRIKHSYFGMSDGMTNDKPSDIPEVKDKDKAKDKGKEDTPISISLVNLWVSKNQKMVEGYPSYRQKIEAEILSALSRGWDAKEIEKQIWNTAGKGVAPWELFKKKDANEPPEFPKLR